MEKIEIINYIKAPASTIYEALTTEKGLGDVRTPKINKKPEAGFVNEFDFNEYP
jgi:hypothetical protein